MNVAQDDLNSFLAVAEDLRVKGLTQGSGSADTASKPKSEQSKYPPVRPHESQMPSEPPSKKSRAAPPQVPSYDDDIQEVLPVKSEPGAAPTAGASHYDVSQDQNQVALEEQYDESYDYGQYGESYDDGSGMIDPNTGLPLQTADGNKGESSFNLFLVRLCLAFNANFFYFNLNQHSMFDGLTELGQFNTVSRVSSQLSSSEPEDFFGFKFIFKEKKTVDWLQYWFWDAKAICLLVFLDVSEGNKYNPHLISPMFLVINLGTHFWLSECSQLLSIYQIICSYLSVK